MAVPLIYLSLILYGLRNGSNTQLRAFLDSRKWSLGGKRMTALSAEAREGSKASLLNHCPLWEYGK